MNPITRTDFSGRMFDIKADFGGAFLVIESTRYERNKAHGYASRQALIDCAHRYCESRNSSFSRYSRADYLDIFSEDERVEAASNFDAVAENGEACEVNGELVAPTKADEFDWAFDALFDDSQSARTITGPADVEDEDYSHFYDELVSLGVATEIETENDEEVE